jgi:hypothetical protein
MPRHLQDAWRGQGCRESIGLSRGHRTTSDRAGLLPLPGLEPARRLHVRERDSGRRCERHLAPRAVLRDGLDTELTAWRVRCRAMRGPQRAHEGSHEREASVVRAARPRRPRRPVRRGRAAGPPAGGGRTRAGHRAGGSAAAAGMFGLFLDQNGPADQFRFGREADGTPAAPWGLGRPGLMASPRPRGTCCTGAGLSGIPTWAGMRHGSPAHGRQHRNRRDELNNTHPNRPNQFFEAQLA